MPLTPLSSITLEVFHSILKVNYVSDMYNHVIRKISTSGIIITILENATYGSTVDGVFPSTSKLDNTSAALFVHKIRFTMLKDIWESSECSINRFPLLPVMVKLVECL